MPRKSNLLTDRAIRNAKAGTHNDGNGLTLRVGANGRRSWVLRYTIDGKAGNVGLGSYPAVGLKEARALAADRRAEISDGQRPTGARAAAAARRPEPQQPAEPTFRDVAERAIVLNEHHWAAGYAAAWRKALDKHVYPCFGDKPISEIGRVDILDALTPIFADRPIMGKRVRQRINTVMAYAVDYELRPDNPTPASNSKALPQIAHQREHFGSVHWTEMPAILGTVYDSPSDEITKLAFHWLVLTAVRKTEGLGTTWNEIDLENRIWTIPAGRMKMRREHRVPLSDMAIDVLTRARAVSGKDTGLVFPSRHKHAITKNALGNMLNRAGLKDFSIHGIRSAVRVYLMEATNATWAAGERVLAHRIGGLETEAYTRSDLLEERRDLMQAWADFLASQSV